MRSSHAARAIVYLPVETSSRELDSRLLISIKKPLRDAIVVVGPSSALKRVSQLYPGVYLHKRHSIGDFQLLKTLTEAGNAVLVIDEEALAFRDSLKEWAQEASDPKVLAFVKRIFSNTSEQFESLKASGVPANLISNSGNPRLELADPIFRNSRLNQLSPKLPERFILINTTFSTGNFSTTYGMDPFEHRRRLNRVAGLDDLQSAHHLEQLAKMYQRETSLMKIYTRTVDLLSKKYHDISIVVRPHPTEDLKAWQQHTKGLNNVIVTRSGSVLPYIDRAICVLHPGCTTALEANQLNVPTIHYDNVSGNEDFPTYYGPRVREVSELTKQIDNAINRERRTEKIELNQLKPSPSSQIAEGLIDLARPTRRKSGLWFFYIVVFALSLSYELIPLSRNIGANLIKLRNRGPWIGFSHSKFPWISRRKILTKVFRLSSAVREQGGHVRSALRVYAAGPRTFFITTKITVADDQMY